MINLDGILPIPPFPHDFICMKCGALIDSAYTEQHKKFHNSLVKLVKEVRRGK